MFPSLGMPELMLIVVIALIVFGPKQLPEVGKALGKTINTLRNASMSGLVEEPDREKEVTAGKVTEEPAGQDDAAQTKTKPGE